MGYLGRTPTPSPIDASDIPTNSIDASKIVDGSIELAEIADNSITDAKLNSSKLDGIEASADVTDTVNVTAAGALMDSEVTNLAQVKAFDTTDYATAAQGTTADAALPLAGGTITGDLAIDGDTTLAAYNNTSAITGNAVDVFIYDTSNDSDGGAWRKRTQATSWYNETLNTSTRGSRKEFPSVAVIVATTTTVTIYDGDDPDMPMWMVFNVLNMNGSTVSSSVFMTNGDLYIGRNIGVYRANLLSDKISNFTINGENPHRYQTDISLRSEAANGTTPDASRAIVNNAANDVAMTVLPNAPIDSTTGLPIPTIAVATDGGVSVIKDDGSVVDITFSSEGFVGRVAFIGDKIRLGGGSQNYIQYAERMYDIPTSDTALGAMYVNDSSALNVYFASSMATNSAFNADMFYNGTTSNKSYAVKNAIGSSTKGLTHIIDNPTDATKGLMAYSTSTYNSGYMTGDIKGAWNVDTDVTTLGTSSDPVVGQNLISNGTFSSDTSGWTIIHHAERSTHNVASGYFHVEGNSSADSAWNASFLMSNGTVSSGAKYQISFDIRSNVAMNTSSSGAGHASWVELGGTFTAFSNVSSTGGSWVTRTFIATAGSANSGAAELRFGQDAPDISTGKYVDIDNVSIKVLGIPDRSVNANGLAVHGTPIVSAVATGAELKCISGFSASNYLEQPYNSDLDFGTGDFSFMGWVNLTGDDESVFDRGNGTSSANRLQLHIYNNTLRMVTAGTTIIAGGSVADGVWSHFSFKRQSGVGTCSLNGVTVASGTCTDNVSGDFPTKVGVSHALAGPMSGSLALLRISATAPTAAQIKEIYEAEKPLFQENAKCTLNGTSDAVQCLAYDDSTELLHVGTSGGRSTFQGLRRVDETATNTTEISAQGGMIIEETA